MKSGGFGFRWHWRVVSHPRKPVFTRFQKIPRFPCRTHRFHRFWPPSAMSYEVFLCQVVSQARKPFFNLLQHIPRFPCRTHRFTRFPTDFTFSLPNAPFSLFLASVSHVLRSFPVPRLELREFWVPVALESHKSSPKAVFHPIPTGSSFSLPNTPFSPKIAWFRTVWAVFGLHVCTFYNFLSLTTFGPDCKWY